MNKLNKSDLELIEIASNIIKKNYDKENYHHTVGAALRCKSGKIYVGVNLYSIHGACAEQIAIGTAIANGEREFETMVAVRGERGDEILPPCGNCRQIMSDYCPSCDVIISNKDEGVKIEANELIPYNYKVD